MGLSATGYNTLQASPLLLGRWAPPAGYSADSDAALNINTYNKFVSTLVHERRNPSLVLVILSAAKNLGYVA
jgi:hypothetical protein